MANALIKLLRAIAVSFNPSGNITATNVQDAILQNDARVSTLDAQNVKLTGNQSVSGNKTFNNTITFATAPQVSGSVGTTRDFNFSTSGSNRWRFRVTSASEAGSNAGSNFELLALSDSGTLIDTPITIPRASGGVVVLTRPVNIANSSGLTVFSDTSGAVIRAETQTTGAASIVVESTGASAGITNLRFRRGTTWDWQLRAGIGSANVLDILNSSTSVLRFTTSLTEFQANPVNITNTTISTSTTTGALTVAGGIGVAGNSFFGGNVNAFSYTQSFLSTTIDRTLTSNDSFVNASTSAGSRTITLPSAVGIAGRTYIIRKNAVSNTLTIATTASQTINGAASLVLNTSGEVARLISDGSNWFTW